MSVRPAGVIALCVVASVATAFGRVPQGRGAGAPPPITPMTGAPSGSPQPTASPVPLVATGLIVGRVIDPVSGRPVSGVTVTLNGGPPRVAPPMPAPSQPPGARPPNFPPQPPRVITDGEGRFAFRNLTRGTFTISASKSGYSGGAYGRTRPDGPSRSLVLDDNERVSDAVIRVFKLASINGRITDEAGEPIVAAQVRVYRRVLVSGKRLFRETGSVQTDDRGIYRVANLTAGDYVVAAPLSSITAPSGRPSAGSEQNFSLSAFSAMGGPPNNGGSGRPIGDGRFVIQSDSNAVAMDSSGRWRGYATQYYPASRSIASAEVLSLPPGDERSGIDIQMRYVPVSSISGNLTIPDGPPGNIVLRLISSDTENLASEPESASTMTDGTGAFLFSGIPSGQYVIQAVRVAREPMQLEMFVPSSPRGGSVTVTSPQNQNRPPSPPMLWATVPVTVSESDVAGVQVAMQEGFHVTGRYDFIGTRARPTGQSLAQIPVVLEPAHGRENAEQGGMPSRANNDGRFITATKSPGKYFLRVGGAPAGFIVQSVTVNGMNAMDTPFDLTGNVTNAVVTFTDQVANLSVAVRGIQPDDDPPLVVLFPADPRAWKDFGINPVRQRSSRAPQSGTVMFGSLIGGEYFLAALPDQFSTEWQDPAYLELLARSAERLTIVPGDKRSISIDIANVKPPWIGRTPAPAPVAAPEDADRAPQAIEQPDGSVIQQPPRQPQIPARDTRAPEPVGLGSVSGTISIDDGAQRPARLARVRLNALSGGLERLALTDEAGRYTIAGLPAGDYTLTLTKPSCLTMYYGARRPVLGPGSVIKVTAGQKVTDINVTILKGAVIAGTVFDEMGQPAPAVRVQLMGFTRREGERFVTTQSTPGATVSQTTNDRGEYRFFGLKPAKYLVMATPSGISTTQELRQLSENEMRAAITEASRSPVSTSVLNSPRTIAPALQTDQPAVPAPGRVVSYSPTYYPGTPRDEEAAELQVSAGQELNNINISLRYVPASRIEGRILGYDGQPALNANVQLLRFSGTGMSSTSTRTSNGGFQAMGVAAGRYQLMAVVEASGRGSPLPAGGAWYAQHDLNLNGDDQLNLVLQLAALPTITGRVVFEGAQPQTLKGVQVSLEPVPSLTTFNMRETRPATTDENGVFTLNGVAPGRYRLNARVSVPRPESQTPAVPPVPGQPLPNSAVGVMNTTGWSVASARVGDQDAYILPFEVRAGQPLGDAEVRLTNQPSEISGKLIDGKNNPVPNMTVVLFPVDRALWVSNTSRMNRISRPNAAGTFSFPLAVPGEYYLAVLTELDNAEWAEPDFKEQLVPAAIRLTLARGEKKVQDLNVGGGL